MDGYAKTAPAGDLVDSDRAWHGGYCEREVRRLCCSSSGPMVYILVPITDFLQARCAAAHTWPPFGAHSGHHPCVFGLFGLLAGLLSYFIPELITQTQQLVSTIPELYANLSADLPSTSRLFRAYS